MRDMPTSLLILAERRRPAFLVRPPPARLVRDQKDATIRLDALHITFKRYNFKNMNVTKMDVRDMIPAAADAADLMRSLSHPQRLLVLCALGAEEKSVAQLREELDVEQVPMSQQLMRLRADGLVEARREGTSVYYRIARPDVLRIIEALQGIYCKP
jgi:DNA-binding transcriptional ArsR family regulator